MHNSISLPRLCSAEFLGTFWLNPAVSFGLAADKRLPARELPAYILAQVAGAIAGAGVLFKIASGKSGFDVSAGFAANGYGIHSPGGYAIGACLPVTNLSLNPVRSSGPALFVGGWALGQLWLFWMAPISGALLAGVTSRALAGESSREPIRASAATAGL